MKRVALEQLNMQLKEQRGDGQPRSASQNACRACTPLGACLAFLGVRGCVPFLHGSQGCATYIRRYMISHFREPIDIASSSLSESTTIFGGDENLNAGARNVQRQYNPELLGVATTCLSETVGEDVPGMVARMAKTDLPPVVHVSTPSYCGSHSEGFQKTITALLEQLAVGGTPLEHINILPNMVSPADLRELRWLMAEMQLSATLVPDYSDRLDGAAWQEFSPIAPGGTSVDELRRTGQARGTVEFSSVHRPGHSPGQRLAELHRVPAHTMTLPVGLAATDHLISELMVLGAKAPSQAIRAQRGRLLDAYGDAHKYVFGKRVVLYGDEDLVVALTGWLLEIGATPVLVASGGQSGRLEEVLRKAYPTLPAESVIKGGVDFVEMATEVKALAPDIFMGNSKGYTLAKATERPLVRVGFPIHDRFGSQRLLHVGYRGAMELLDRLVNALLDYKQDSSPIGYAYL